MRRSLRLVLLALLAFGCDEKRRCVQECGFTQSMCMSHCIDDKTMKECNKGCSEGYIACVEACGDKKK